MIRSGRVFLNSDYAGYKLHEGNGLRVVDYNVTFKAEFPNVPQVAVAFDTLDVNNTYNTRVRAYAKDITPFGFTIQAETWGPSEVYGIGLQWIAYEE